MYNLKPAIYMALSSNSALVNLVGKGSDGKPAIYQITASDASIFPRITFFELSNIDSVYADDDTIASDIGVQIDIWSKGNASAIASEVDNTMRANGWKRIGSQDLYEYDTQIFHNPLRYETQYSQ